MAAPPPALLAGTHMPIDPKTAVYSASAAMLSEFGLSPGNAPPYRCADPKAVPIPVSELHWPRGRGLDPARLRRVLGIIARREPLAPVPVYREPGSPVAVVLDGAHRLAVSIALGYDTVPCELLSRDEAEGG